MQIDWLKEKYGLERYHYELRPLVYFLCQKGRIVYVGSTNNLHARLNAHRMSKVYDEVYCLEIRGRRERQRLETELIQALLPKYNSISVVPGRVRKPKTHIEAILEKYGLTSPAA